MHSYNALRIDQHIPTELLEVRTGYNELTPFSKEFCVDPPCRRPVYIPPAAVIHTVSVIQGPGFIHQQRPLEVRIPNIGLCKRPRLKRHHGHPHTQVIQLIFDLTQLRQMFAARQSAEMPMKHQQQPVPTIVRQRMHHAVCIGQFKINGCFSAFIIHGAVLSRTLANINMYADCWIITSDCPSSSREKERL